MSQQQLAIEENRFTVGQLMDALRSQPQELRVFLGGCGQFALPLGSLHPSTERLELMPVPRPNQKRAGIAERGEGQ